MENIYFLSDIEIKHQIGQKIKSERLRQNVTQENLALNSGVSLSTLKKIENGEISSFTSFLMVIRALGLLDNIESLLEPHVLSPNEYFEMVHSQKKKIRKKASVKKNVKQNNGISEW